MTNPDAKTPYEAPDPGRPASAAPTEPQLLQDTTPHDPYAALRYRDYRLLVGGHFLSVIAGQMLTTTALYEIYQKTGSPMNLGWVGIALAAPMLLLSLPAGHFADTHSRRRIIMTTQLMWVCVAVGLAALSRFGSAWHYDIAAMYALLSFGGAVGTFGRPARASLMPQTVPPPVFNNAVTWNSSIFETAAMIGPAAGGFLCGRSIPLAYAVAAVCGTVSFFAMSLLPKRPPAHTGRRAGFPDLIAGVKFVYSTRLMVGAMTLDMFAVLLGGAVFLLPAFAEDILHVGATGFGWLRAAPAIGSFSMAMFQAHRRPIRHAGRALLLAVAGFGVAIIVFGLSRNYWLSLAMLVLTGMFDNISVVIRHTLIQLLTPDSMRGRVSAVNQIFIGSSNELGGFESGITAKWFGLVQSVVIGGIGTLLVVSGVAIAWPEVRKLGSLKDIKPGDMPEPRALPIATTTANK